MFKRRHLVIVLLAIAIGLLLLMVSTSAFNSYLSVTGNIQLASTDGLVNTSDRESMGQLHRMG